MLTLFIGSISSVGVKIFAKKVHTSTAYECYAKYDGDYHSFTSECHYY
jgi:hypothetical protein